MDDQTADNQERFLEVIGGYDEDFGDPPTRRPLPRDAVPVVRELKDAEQVRRYLFSLPDEFLIKNYRHIQYRNLANGTLHDFYGYAPVNRSWGGPEPIEAGQVVPLSTADTEFYAEDLSPARTVGELLRHLQQLPPDLLLQCGGQDFVQLTVCKNGEQYIAVVEESCRPDAESGAAEDDGA